MKINKIIVLSIIILFFGTILTTQVQPTNQRSYEKDDYIPGEIIVGLKKDFDMNNLNPGNKDPFLGKKIININKKINFIVLKVEHGMEDNYIEKYTSFSKVNYAEKNIVMKSDDYIPNDSAWDRQ